MEGNEMSGDGVIIRKNECAVTVGGSFDFPNRVDRDIVRVMPITRVPDLSPEAVVASSLVVSIESSRF